MQFHVHEGEVLKTAMARFARILTECGIEDAATDVRSLAADALSIERGRLSLFTHEPVSAEAAEKFCQSCERRANREPVSKILGRRLFFGRWFKSNANVLDPRPETEVLVELALSLPFETFLDLGTGSGCIAITLLSERDNSFGLASDASSEALKVAKENARRHHVAEKFVPRQSDWFDAIDEKFDLIVSNPPYIHPNEMAGLSSEVVNFDPHIALTDGKDGLSSYRAICKGVLERLNPGGHVLVEIGPTQAANVVELFSQTGLRSIDVIMDLDGRDRVVKGQAP